MFIQVLFILLLSILRNVDGYSACDETDITIIVDTDSIKADQDNKIIDLITSIVERGCSELSAFSVWIYGDNIPDDVKPNVVTLDDTVDTTTRSQLVDVIETELIADFSAIRSSLSDGRSVDLETIFNAASRQHKPRRSHERTQQTNIAGLGSHDDEDEYLIFNRNLGDDFIRTQKDTICQLFEHEENGDETVHFLLYNSDYDYFSEDDDDVPEIVCNGGSFIPDIKRDTFINFAELIEDDEGNFNEERLEVIYRATCPANVDASGDLGDGNKMELGNHDQFIDALTIIACSIIDNDEHPDSPDLTDDSYILVKDIIGDDNTFNIDDYLLITDGELAKLVSAHPECCELPPLHIKRIVDDDDLNDDTSYVQRKVFVEIPRSATEYIIDANLAGDVPGPRRDTLCPSDPDVDGRFDRNPQVLKYILEILAGIATDDDYDPDETDGAEGALSRRLFEEDFSLIGGPLKWENTFSDEYTKGGMTASVDYGYDFGFDTRLYIRFDWSLWPWGYIDLEFKIYGYLEANAWFHLHIKFEWSKTVELLNWHRTFSPRISGVAIVIRPFFVLQARFETLPFIISAGIDCGYRREWEVGYFVKTDSWFSNFRHGKIESSRTTKNGCEKYYEIGQEGNQMATMCDPYILGLDVYIEPIVGVALYEIVAAWIRLELKIPFRIQIPETDSSICSYNRYDCNGTPLKASFKLEPFELSLYFGYELDVTVWKILELIGSLATGYIHGKIEVSDYTGIQIGGPWTLTGTITLGCINLDWLFPGNWVENYIESRCCDGSSRAESAFVRALPAPDTGAALPTTEIFSNENVLIAGIAILMTSLLIISYINCVGCGNNNKSSKKRKYKKVAVDSAIDSSDIEYGSEVPLNDE